MGTFLSVLGLAAMAGFFSFSNKTDHDPEVHFADKPAELKVRKGGDGDKVEQVSIRELLSARCPSLFTPFTPLWWLNR